NGDKDKESKKKSLIELSKLVIENSFALIGRYSTSSANDSARRKKKSSEESKDTSGIKNIVQKISGYYNQKDRLNELESERQIREIFEDYSLNRISDSDLEYLIPIDD